MSNYSSPFAIWFILFALIGYFVVTDSSISKAFYYSFELLRLNCRKIAWWLLHNPNNPIVKWMMYRKYLKVSDRILKQIKENGE
jgi:hypothetical protein